MQRTELAEDRTKNLYIHKDHSQYMQFSLPSLALSLSLSLSLSRHSYKQQIV